MLSKITRAIFVKYMSLAPWKGQVLEQHSQEVVSHISQSLDLSLATVEESGTQEVFNKILMLSEGYENILIFHSNAPFVFPSLSQEILQKHEQFLVDYTFAEYLPWGLSPIAIRRDILQQILPSLASKEYSPFLLDRHIKSDLNSYDIEIVLADNDYRFIKESLIATDQRAFSMIKELFERSLPTTSVKTFLQASFPFLRTAPSFVEVALVNDPSRKALFQSPISNAHKMEINPSHLTAMLLSLWEQNPSLTLQFSLQDGEPCSHPSFEKILDFIKDHPHNNFILETFGEGLENYWEKIQYLANLTIIFYLGATSEKTYQETHALSNLKDKEALAEYHLKHRPGQTYLQWVRMTENEPELAEFLKRWGAFEKNILISQYNNFSNTKANKKVADFSPIRRFPCFKLLRDLYIPASGNIALCSIDQENILLDTSSGISQEDWKHLWLKMGEIYSSHAGDIYPDKCKNCDYWYIFNL